MRATFSILAFGNQFVITGRFDRSEDGGDPAIWIGEPSNRYETEVKGITILLVALAMFADRGYPRVGCEARQETVPRVLQRHDDHRWS